MHHPPLIIKQDCSFAGTPLSQVFNWTNMVWSGLSFLSNKLSSIHCEALLSSVFKSPLCLLRILFFFFTPVMLWRACWPPSQVNLKKEKTPSVVGCELFPSRKEEGGGMESRAGTENSYRCSLPRLQSTWANVGGDELGSARNHVRKNWDPNPHSPVPRTPSCSIQNSKT